MEFKILDWIQSNLRNDFLDTLLPIITKLGNGGIFWISLSIVFIFKKSTRKMGITMLVSMLLGFLVANVSLKPLIARTRPFDIKTDIKLLIQAPKDFSFPSGHTLSSFTAATSIFLFKKKWGILAYILSTAIAFSRLYLYVHFPTDVLAGLILGLFLAWVGYYIVNIYYKKYENV